MMTSRNVEEGSSETTIDLRQFLATIVRRRWLVLVVTLGVTTLAALYSFTRPAVYTSSADVLVRPILANPLEPLQTDRMSLPTEMRIATSAAVSSIAMSRLGSTGDPNALLADVSVTSPDDAQIIEISFSALDRKDAQRGAQAFADAYLDFKTDQAVTTITQRASTLQTGINKLADQINALNDKMAGLLSGRPERADLVDQRSALETTRLTLQTQLATVTALSTDPGSVIQPAEVPSSPSRPKHPIDLSLGVLIGLMIGIGLASASERLRDRMDRPESLERLLEAPVLGVIPKLSGGQRKLDRPVTLEQPKSQAAEAFRMLRTNLLAHGARPPVRTLLVTSAWPREGKTTVATNLAATLAQVGRDVVLISADLRFPRAHTYFGLDGESGLGQVLMGEVTLDEALYASPVPHLRVLPSGPVEGVAEPVELIQSEKMLEVIERCAETDFVIIDGSPILAVADSLVIATMVDVVLFVADARNGKTATVAQSRYQLRQVGANVIGGVLNGVEGWKRAHGGYGAYDYQRSLLSRILTPEPNGNGRSDVVPPELRKQTSA